MTPQTHLNGKVNSIIMSDVSEQKEWNDDLYNVYKKYPSSIRSDKWPEIKKLALKGKKDKADDLAKSSVKTKSQNAENIMARRIRLQRMAFLALQDSMGDDIQKTLNRIGARVEKIVLRGVETQGKRLKAFKEIDRVFADYRKNLHSTFNRGIRQSAVMGLKQMGDAMKPVIRDNVESFLDEIIELQSYERALQEEPLSFGLDPKMASRIEKGLEPNLRTIKWSATIQRIMKKVVQQDNAGLTLSERIWNLSNQSKKSIRSILSRGISRGVSNQKLASQAKKYLVHPEKAPDIDLSPGEYSSPYKNAWRMTRTETNRAYTKSSMEWGKGKKWLKGVRFTLSNEHHIPCACNNYAGNIYTPEKLADIIPVHPHAIIEGEMVSASDAIAATKAFYDGIGVQVRLANGRCFTVTQGHPILTSRGWVMAKDLNEFDKVFSTANSKGVSAAINPNNEQGPTRIEDVFASIEKSNQMSAARMNPSPEDFHGDGKFFKGKIDIVRADRFLLSHVKSLIAQAKRKFGFDWRNILRESLKSLSPINLMLPGIFNPALCHESVGSGARLPRFDSGDTANLRKGSFNPTIDKNLSERFRRNMIFARKFVDRFSNQVELNQIVKINTFRYAGHVYDLQCANYGLFMSNGAIVSNCMCYGAYVINNKYLEGK